VRITLKKAYTDGTIAVDMDPLSLLCRLATSVPAPTFLAAMGEATEVPHRSRVRCPPYWQSRVLRRQALGDEDGGQGRWVPENVAGVGNGGRATGRRSLRLEPDRGHQAFSLEGPASQSRARRGR
jgi:hypothetical protein